MGRLNRYKGCLIAGMVFLVFCLSGCEKQKESAPVETTEQQEEKTGLENETAGDGHINFEVLQAENPDIFGWLYVPGTNIDMPLLQSGIEDNYYETHLADGTEGDGGALYTEMANLINMCDFNTIIHGKDLEETDSFYQLHQFENPDFFESQDLFYIYLPDNVLTYGVLAAYYDDDSSILRRFDYTTFDGCSRYLDEIYGKQMGKNLREGWDKLTPYHFMVTLNGSVREEQESQYVVVGVLISDAADKIDRVILD